jgi:predicted Rossmann fold flavoprotein
MRCAVIGGGAAGLMAACALARSGTEVTVLERQPRVGKKLLATGNGRCNFTNVNARPENYHGARDVAAEILSTIPPARVIEEFSLLGIPARIDPEGRAYPASNAASSVLDALRLALAEAGGAEKTDFDAVQVERGFRVLSRDGAVFPCDRVLVATGGPAAPALGGTSSGHELLRTLGHAVSPLLPAIAPLKTELSPIKGLKGQRARCEVTLFGGKRAVRTEAGEVLFTETGVSGICCMQLARAAQGLKDARLTIDFAPGAGADLLAARARTLPQRRLEDFLNGLLPRRVGWAVLRAAGISDLSRVASSLSDAELASVECALRAFPLRVAGVSGFDAAQVTAGGVDMREFDSATLESRLVPGLFVAGEVCDVDGDCGGYNLQWAWASALAAAKGILAGLDF